MARVLTLLLLLSSVVWAEKNYQTGTLMDVSQRTETRGGFIAGGTGTTSVTDVIYELSVAVDGEVIIGSYSPFSAFSYEPTDFTVNEAFQVRLDGKKMYLKRPNGKELKTRIIKRVNVSTSAPAKSAEPRPSPQ